MPERDRSLPPRSALFDSGPYLRALLDGRRREASAIVHRQADAGHPLIDIYEEVMLPALYQVGELWAAHRLSVAVEHLCTAITEGILNELYPRVATGPRKGRSVVLACVEGELHQVGVRMVCDAFEINGWEGHFLGADTPLPDLLRLIDERPPQAVSLSLGVSFHLPALERAMDAIRAAWPRLPLLIGGQGLRPTGAAVAATRPGVYYERDLYGLDGLIKSGALDAPAP